MAAHKILIVGGGTAGWLTACYLAARLGCRGQSGVAIQVVESPDIAVVGVGEGTFPTIRKTLSTIGINEADLVRRCGATFKQGAMFSHWGRPPGLGQEHRYLHGFQTTDRADGLDLLPYWLLGLAGGKSWDEAATPQRRAAEADRAPKLYSHPDFVGPLNYAYHFDAVAFGRLLRERAVELGVVHSIDTVVKVDVGDSGAITAVHTQMLGPLSADLYVDCTGFRAQLIGEALGSPFRSCRNTLFCDRALAAQVPYAERDAAIRPYTLATAQEAGWVWDIGLDTRRGVGYVYSANHIGDDEAETALRRYLGADGEKCDVRKLTFEAGYRETSWQKNCVAIGLSSGFFEPLEATGIVLIEAAASLVASLFPWSRDYEVSARQYNRLMTRRYERTRDFIKLHYCLSSRRDSAFWRDNVDEARMPDSLVELLERWKFRPPSELDIDQTIDFFPEASWQFVLYGMDWVTDLRPKAGVFRYADDARAAFAEVSRQGAFAVANLPSNRQLVEAAKSKSFGPRSAAA